MNRKLCKQEMKLAQSFKYLMFMFSFVYLSFGVYYLLTDTFYNRMMLGFIGGILFFIFTTRLHRLIKLRKVLTTYQIKILAAYFGRVASAPFLIYGILEKDSYTAIGFAIFFMMTFVLDFIARFSNFNEQKINLNHCLEKGKNNESKI